MEKKEILRAEVEWLLKEREQIENKLQELAYKLYEEEEGKELEGLNVRGFGYKKVLRALGYVM